MKILQSNSSAAVGALLSGIDKLGHTGGMLPYAST